jgi:hypothetical protein
VQKKNGKECEEKEKKRKEVRRNQHIKVVEVQSFFFHYSLNNICIIFTNSWLILTWFAHHDEDTLYTKP